MMEIDHAKPRGMYVDEAMVAAAEGRWHDAVDINRRLIEAHGADEEAHNRLGKALIEVGDVNEALAAYQATLAINPINAIAQKNVAKLERNVGVRGVLIGTGSALDVELFAEEPGKSTVTTLVPLKKAPEVEVAAGDIVNVVPIDGLLVAQTVRGQGLGTIDPKISRRLIPLMDSGNHYAAAVARVSDLGVEVVIREAYQSPVNVRKTSFPVSKRMRSTEEIRPYSKTRTVVHSRDDALEPEEDDDVEAVVQDPVPVTATATTDDDTEEDALPPDEDVDDDSRPEDEF